MSNFESLSPLGVAADVESFLDKQICETRRDWPSVLLESPPMRDKTNEEVASDAIDPQHYRSHPSGIECIQITEHMNFNLGNVVKYIWRADLKAARLEDLRKAQWYLDREIERRIEDLYTGHDATAASITLKGSNP